MKKEDAINQLMELINTAEQQLLNGESISDFIRNIDGVEKWYRDAQVAIEKIFGKKTTHIECFNKYEIQTLRKINSRDYQIVYRQTKSGAAILKSFIDEINSYGLESSVNETAESSAIDKVQLIINRFHQVARQLQARHSERNTIEINDEYDVQDLFHALLKLYFDDIRPEEYTPSYAGSASRVDFLLKDEKIIIEIKKTRNTLKAKEVGEQLIIDTQKYQAHPECKTLICFVYDPEGKIANPRGIEKDLSKDFNGLPVSVFITP